MTEDIGVSRAKNQRPLKNPSIIDIIRKKRNGLELNAEDIDWFIQSACQRRITDAQIGAMLMAICVRGMTNEETIRLTEAMIRSGGQLQHPPDWKGQVVGKHSTGGIGDKVSLVLVPALAACGLKVPKMSGRGLGLTGGTLDKLESIPGCKVYFDSEQISLLVEKVGCCIVGQSDDLAPADKLLYAIRDTTATQDSVPLIAASIMSKKAAEKLDALCLEVTYGKAALAKTKQEADRLARLMQEIGSQLHTSTTALLVCMDNVLGQAVGNTLEVIEAVRCLRGHGPQDVVDVVCTTGGYLMWQTVRADSPQSGYRKLQASLNDGSAVRKFQAMIEAQGVPYDIAAALVEGDTTVLPKAEFITRLKCPRTGYVSGIDAFVCGAITHRLGSGRIHPGDSIDCTVGLQLLVSIGSFVIEGDDWVEVHHNHGEVLSTLITSQLQKAISIVDSEVDLQKKSVITDVYK